jgi:hypothetical protein
MADAAWYFPAQNLEFNIGCKKRLDGLQHFADGVELWSARGSHGNDDAFHTEGSNCGILLI